MKKILKAAAIAISLTIVAPLAAEPALAQQTSVKKKKAAVKTQYMKAVPTK